MKYYSTTVLKGLLCLLLLSAAAVSHAATTYIQNVYGRHSTSLNGKWSAIVDPYDAGYNMRVFLDRKSRPSGNFYEYDFDGATRLNVPGDWNSQRDELKYYEGTVWYARHFNFTPTGHQRHFLYFAGVSNRCKVYLNGQLIATHEGAFTPFQVEVGDKLVSGDNLLVVAVNNTRRVDAIPAMSFDWWNYGGITRDVMLVTLPDTYISDYFIRLDKHRSDLLLADVSLSRPVAGQRIVVTIHGAGVKMQLTTDANGVASGRLSVRKLQRWSPDKPTLYATTITAPNDTVTEQIGFRNINVEKTKVLLNDQPVFLRGVSFHEEIAQRMGRATSMADAVALVTEAKNLGCNMVRLAHYQQNEYIVREAERQGLMVWQEVPVWQSIDFTNDSTLRKAQQMLRETDPPRPKPLRRLLLEHRQRDEEPTEARNRLPAAQLLKTGKADRHHPTLCRPPSIWSYFDKPRDAAFRHARPLLSQHLDRGRCQQISGLVCHAWPVRPSARSVWQVAPDNAAAHLGVRRRGTLRTCMATTRVASTVGARTIRPSLYRDNLRNVSATSPTSGRHLAVGALRLPFSPTRLHSDQPAGLEPQGAGLRPRPPQGGLVHHARLLHGPQGPRYSKTTDR
jgi:hypothetical protein